MQHKPESRRGVWLAVSFTLVAVAISAAPVEAQQDGASAPPPLRELDFGPFATALEALSEERVAALDEFVIEATFAELQAAMEAGDLTAVELTTYYLARIREIDVDGLRSMLELNPDALTIAAQLDAERASGEVRGPLHGIPISLKDNIGTGDAMHTIVGAAALAQARSDRDSHVAGALRQAGAVIIGKANMSEWAYFMHGGPSGYSALGGQVVSPTGRSTRRARAPAPRSAPRPTLVAASIGTETAGSLIAPASVSGVVGIHPTLGLVSRDRIIPLTDQTDTAGPVARTVMDAAILLTAIAGLDPNDPTTVQEGSPTDYAAGLAPDALADKRLGLFLTKGVPVEDLTRAVEALEEAGAEILILFSGDEGPGRGEDLVAFLPVQDDLMALMDDGLRIGFAEFAASTGLTGAITSIADVVAFNEQDAEAVAFHGQPLLVAAAESTLSREEYEASGARIRERGRSYIDGLFAEAELDAIVSINNGFSLMYATAGYPAITVPAGLTNGTPFGLTFAGRLFEDAEIIGYAYALEQASLLREVPRPSGGD